MTPPREPGIDLDLGMGIAVDVTVGEAGGGSGDGEGPAMAYLLKFDPAVTPAQAVGVLGRLSPPEEGIVLAGQGAVVVRAGRPFVETAKATDVVALVHPVRTAEWEPNRHPVRADDG